MDSVDLFFFVANNLLGVIASLLISSVIAIIAYLGCRKSTKNWQQVITGISIFWASLSIVALLFLIIFASIGLFLN